MKLRKSPVWKACVVTVLIISMLTAALGGVASLVMIRIGMYDDILHPGSGDRSAEEAFFNCGWVEENLSNDAYSAMCVATRAELVSETDVKTAESEGEVLFAMPVSGSDVQGQCLLFYPGVAYEDMMSKSANVVRTIFAMDGTVIAQNFDAINKTAAESYVEYYYIQPNGELTTREMYCKGTFGDDGFDPKELLEMGSNMEIQMPGDIFDIPFNELNAYAVGTFGRAIAGNVTSTGDVTSAENVHLNEQQREYAIHVLCDYAWFLYEYDYYDYGVNSDGSAYIVERAKDELDPIGCIVYSAALDRSLTVKDSYNKVMGIYKEYYKYKMLIPALTLLGVLLSVVCFVLVLCFAGWRRGSDKPQLTIVDKIPTDLYLVLLAAVEIISTLLLTDVSYDVGNVIGWLLFVLLGAAFCVSAARRIKAGTFLRNTVIARVWSLLGKCLHALPDVWQVLLLSTMYCAATFVLFAVSVEARTPTFLLLFWLPISVFAIVLVCRRVLQFARIAGAAKRMAAGEGEQLELKGLKGSLRKHAESINSMSSAVGAAVEEKLKSERMKTDLITNVSHDIKTPLTSIINYVDLLKSTDVTDERALEYISVLDRQSVRLKRLVENLVEASKASSGCIAVHNEPTDMHEMLEQATAEYADKMTLCGLTPVVNAPQGLTVSADGKLLWRVFDNLLSNVCKYAQQGTRVYIDAAQKGDKVVTTFRNISSEKLNISPEELMERFVRGDISRATEGSGLGLSIARSLTELQGGEFSLHIDGDLFCAGVTLNSCQPKVQTVEELQLEVEDAPVEAEEMLALNDDISQAQEQTEQE